MINPLKVFEKISVGLKKYLGFGYRSQALFFTTLVLLSDWWFMGYFPEHGSKCFAGLVVFPIMVLLGIMMIGISDQNEPED